jgi:hypothetical protein
LQGSGLRSLDSRMFRARAVRPPEARECLFAAHDPVARRSCRHKATVSAGVTRSRQRGAPRSAWARAHAGALGARRWLLRGISSWAVLLPTKTHQSGLMVQHGCEEEVTG